MSTRNDDEAVPQPEQPRSVWIMDEDALFAFAFGHRRKADWSDSDDDGGEE